MKLIELATELIPEGIHIQEIPLQILFAANRMPVPAFWPEGKGKYLPGIMVPELTVEESIEAVTKSVPNDPCIVFAIEDLLRENHLISTDQSMSPYLYSTFSILHELGHCLDFQSRYADKGLSGSDFYSDYQIEELKLGLDEIGQLAKKEREGSKKFIYYLTMYHKKYRENPFEVIADRYALNRLLDMK